MSKDDLIWRAQAPSNIALIKYMGKESHSGNLPSNASLSYTLDHLLTLVELERIDESSDRWEALETSGWSVQLSEKGQSRFLKHFAFLKETLGLQGAYCVRSANNFPSDCGIASSASSFAALTLCAYEAALEVSERRAEVDAMSLEALSSLSRQGSGSSCRSFFRPWAVWRAEGAEPVKFPLEFLHHQVVLFESGKKDVSSSEAHRRVTSSQLFQGRTQRAEERLKELFSALNVKDWERIYQLCWAEFWDMHALFETSDPAFGYMKAKSLATLQRVRECWRELKDGPVATMDAGANVHLLYRPDQTRLAKGLAQELRGFADILESPELVDAND